MPRRLSGQPRPTTARTASLIPAATLGGRFAQTAAAADWQTDIRNMDRDGPGVCGYYLDLVSLLASLCPLVPETQQPNGDWVPSDDPVLNTLLRGYSSPLTPQSELVGLHVRHRESMGEAWLINSEHLGWNIATVPNVRVDRNSVQWTDPFGRRRITPVDRAWKSWTQDPYEPWKPHSPLRRARNDLHRLRAAERNQTRSANSPLATNGIMAFPDDGGGMRPLAEEGTFEGGADQVVSDFIDLAKISFDDDSHPAAGVPFPMIGQKPEYVAVGRPIDASSFQMEDKALEAFARAVNFPAKLLVAGPGDANHWNEWLLEEAQRKMGLAPKLLPVCADITAAYYRPMVALARQRIGDFTGVDINRVRVGFDTSFLTSKPDTTSQVLSAWSAGVLEREAVADALGLPTDALLTLPEGLEEYEHWQIATSKPGAPYTEVEDGAVKEAPDVFGEGSPADTFGGGELPPEDQPGQQQLPGVAEPAPLPPGPTLGQPEPLALGAANQAIPPPPAQLAALTEDQRIEETVIDRLYRADVALEAALSARARLCIETVTDHTAREIVKAHTPRSPERAALRDLPAVEVWLAATPEVRASFDLAGTVEEAVDRCADRVPFHQAATAALAALAPLGFAPVFDEDRGHTVLVLALGMFVTGRFNKGGGADALPVQDIRSAMVAAGGGRVSADGALVRSADGQPVPERGGTWRGNTGMTTGDTVFQHWPEHGGTVDMTTGDTDAPQEPATRRLSQLHWRWVHSFFGEPDTPFPPHVALDGQVFPPGSIVTHTGGFHPGDHLGCRCALVPEVVAVPVEPIPSSLPVGAPT